MTRWKFCEIIFRGDKGKFRIVRGLYAERLSYTYAVVWEHDNVEEEKTTNWLNEKRSLIPWGKDRKAQQYLVRG